MSETMTPAGTGTPSAPAAPSSSSPSSKVLAPLGAEPAAPSGTQDLATNQSSVRDFGDDDLVRIQGSDKPIKYGDLYKRMQGDYTRKQQELRADIARERAEIANARQHNEQLAASLLARQNQPQATPGADNAAKFLSALGQRQSVSGQDMVQILGMIKDEGFGNVVRGFEARDTVIKALYNKIVALEKVTGSVSQDRANTAFEAKIDGWLKDLDLGPEYKDLAMETYLAHEGADLDEQFPSILSSRVDTLHKAWQSREKQRVEAARNPRFSLPGKGGSAAPGKPLQLSGRESAKQQADMIWDALQAQDGMAT